MFERREVNFINTLKGITDLVDWAAFQDHWTGDLQPPLYVDLEGERLSRNGNISLLTVLCYPGEGQQQVYVIDIHTLGSAAFHIAGLRGKSLKNILESPNILKVFFDVRNDSDALYAHYGIELRGVRDVQLMESATRRSTQSRKFVCGLSKCIESVLSRRGREQWKLCKDTGEPLWNPDKGGSYSAFNARPISNDIIAYCAGDVQYLPDLYHKYKIGTDRWGKLIAEESQNRVSASQKAEYQPDGPQKTRSPWSSEQNRMLDTWSEVNPQLDWDEMDIYEDEPQDISSEREYWDDYSTSCRDIISDSDYRYYYSD